MNVELFCFSIISSLCFFVGTRKIGYETTICCAHIYFTALKTKSLFPPFPSCLHINENKCHYVYALWIWQNSFMVIAFRFVPHQSHDFILLFDWTSAFKSQTWAKVLSRDKTAWLQTQHLARSRILPWCLARFR